MNIFTNLLPNEKADFISFWVFSTTSAGMISSEFSQDSIKIS